MPWLAHLAAVPLALNRPLARGRRDCVSFTCGPDTETYPRCDLSFFGTFGSTRLAGFGPSVIRRVCCRQYVALGSAESACWERPCNSLAFGTVPFDCGRWVRSVQCGKILEEKWKIQTEPAVAKKLAHLSTYGNSWNGACHSTL